MKILIRLCIIIIILLSANLLYGQLVNITVDWQKLYNNFENNDLSYASPTKDNGCIICGEVTKDDLYKTDFWLMKINFRGMAEWNRSFNAPGYDKINSVIQTADNGYIACGENREKKNSPSKIWVMKTNFRGIQEWNKVFTLGKNASAHSVISTQDGGYALCGEMWVDDSKQDNFFLLKLNAKGNVEWRDEYGSKFSEKAYSLIETYDGGFAICGEKKLADNDSDFWLIKLTKNGSMQWDRLIGGYHFDQATRIFQMHDKGYTICGKMLSDQTDKEDFWVLKLNTNGETVWNKSFGGFGIDAATSITYTSDDGFAICGITKPDINNDHNFWVMKLNNKGVSVYSKEFVGFGKNTANFIVESHDSNFFVIGTTYSKITSKTDLWVMRLSEEIEPTITSASSASNFLNPSKASSKSWHNWRLSSFDQNYRNNFFIPLEKKRDWYFKSVESVTRKSITELTDRRDRLTSPSIHPVRPFVRYYGRFGKAIAPGWSTRYGNQYRPSGGSTGLGPRFVSQPVYHPQAYNPNYRRVGSSSSGSSPNYLSSLKIRTPAMFSSSSNNKSSAGHTQPQSKRMLGGDLKQGGARMSAAILVPMIFLWIVIFGLIFLKLISKPHI